jgi:hypothetical protein
MFETFALRLAAGLAASLAVLPGEVHPRFFRIQWLIVLGLLTAAGVFAWNTAGEWFWLPYGLALVLSGAGFWCWAAEELRGARRPVLAAGLAALAGCLLFQGPTVTPVGTAQALAAAGLLGLTTTAMLMGHWYLIAPTMSLKPLFRLLRGFFLALGLRLVLAAADLAAAPDLDRVAWLWLGLRWLAGLVLPFILGWMAWAAARIRSTQSATGILYVVVVCVFIGELTDQLLRDYLGPPP